MEEVGTSRSDLDEETIPVGDLIERMEFVEFSDLQGADGEGE